MSDSQTKRMIIKRHQSNELLQAPTLSPIQRPEGGDLGVDQPTQQPDLAVVESSAKALEEGQTHYAPVPGIDPLREAVASYLNNTGLADYGQEKILITAGIQECRFLSIQMIGGLFGCVALPEVVHPGARKAVGVRQIDLGFLPVDKRAGMLPTLAGMKEALKSGCKLLYLESPVRLTGAVFDAPLVEEIAGMVKEFDAGVIWDQGLAPWVPNGKYVSLGAQPGMSERVAVLGEAWPGVGLESWFIGYVGAKEDWFEPMRSQKQIISICTSTPTQFAALKAAELYAETHAAQLRDLARARQRALELAGNSELKPLAGSVVNLIALQTANPAQTRAALRQAGFSFADGADFGAQDVLRLSIMADDTTEEALKQLT